VISGNEKVPLRTSNTSTEAANQLDFDQVFLQREKVVGTS